MNLESRHGRDRFLSRARQQLLRLVRETGAHGSNAQRRLEDVFNSHVAFIASHPDVPRRILAWALQGNDARLRRRIRKVIGHYEFRVLRVITQGQREGSLRADIEPKAATVLFVGILQTLALRMPAEGSEPGALLEEAKRLFSAFLEVVRNDGAARDGTCAAEPSPA
jgi:AcrR family transcriptional regulator